MSDPDFHSMYLDRIAVEVRDIYNELQRHVTNETEWQRSIATEIGSINKQLGELKTRQRIVGSIFGFFAGLVPYLLSFFTRGH